MNLPEKDWKYASKLRDRFLERLCERINLKSVKILGASELTQHEKYLLLYKHMDESDKLIAIGFNDWRRSKAIQCLIFYRQQTLITDLEYEEFSFETKCLIDSWLGIEKK